MFRLSLTEQANRLKGLITEPTITLEKKVGMLFLHINPSRTSVGLIIAPEDYDTFCRNQTLRFSSRLGRIQLVRGRSVLHLAHQLLGCPVGFSVGYRDGDCRNLLRDNLVLSEPVPRKGRAIGIRPHRKVFAAYLQRGRKRVHLGSFPTEEEATAALAVAKADYVATCSARTPSCCPAS